METLDNSPLPQTIGLEPDPDTMSYSSASAESTPSINSPLPIDSATNIAVEPVREISPEAPPTPLAPSVSLAMPDLYIKASTPAMGFWADDDLQIEVILPQKEPSRFSLWFTEFGYLVRDFGLATLTAFIIIYYVIQPVKVEGTSMLPTLHDDERIFINKLAYQYGTIERQDIVVFWYPKNPKQSFIKRVIGLPGDEVRITNGKLYVNNKLVAEPYLSPEYTTNVIPNRYWLVEEHHYFVMGDNRDASNDSRSWGSVPEKYIYGKAVFRYWPMKNGGILTDK